MLGDLTSWLLTLASKIFKEVWDFLQDITIEVFDLFITAATGLLAAVPVPAQFSNGLNSLFQQLDPAVLYLVGVFGLPEALAMFGVAFVFRMGRKIVTLFQW